jgi:hypothetical protein
MSLALYLAFKDAVTKNGESYSNDISPVQYLLSRYSVFDVHVNCFVDSNSPTLSYAWIVL